MSNRADQNSQMRKVVIGALLIALSGRTGDASSTSDAKVGTIPCWPPVSIPPDEFFLLVEDCFAAEGFRTGRRPRGVHDRFSGITTRFGSGDSGMHEQHRSTYLEAPPPFTEEQLADLYLYATDQRDCYVEFGIRESKCPVARSSKQISKEGLIRLAS